MDHATAMRSNTHTVQVIYEAFGRGDVPAILDTLDDSIEWETQAPGAGRAVAAAAPRESQRRRPLRSHCTSHDHSLRNTVFDGGDKVFVLIAFEATSQGRHYSFPNNGHLWQFNSAGKVVAYDHITDRPR